MHVFNRKIFLLSCIVGRGILQSPYIGGGWGNSRGHVLGGDVKFQGHFVRLG